MQETRPTDLATAPAGAVRDLPVSVSPQVVPDGAPLDHPSLYFNRELGDLDFNWRVLAQAMDERIPLLERVRYLALAAANLDEFFQKRVGGLRRQEEAGVTVTSPDGRRPAEQLALIRDAARSLYARLNELWRYGLEPALEEAGAAQVLNRHELTADQRAFVAAHFRTNVYPIVTPLAVDSGRPFPFISNLSLSLAVRLRAAGTEDDLFVRLKVPLSGGRFLDLGGGAWLPLDQVVKEHVGELFPGMRVLGAWAFRVTRNADIRLDEEEAEDLIASISEELRERRFAPVVRLEVEHDMPGPVRDYLARHMAISGEDIYEARSLLGLADVKAFLNLPRPELRFERWRGTTAPRILEHTRGAEGASLFDLIRHEDVLVHHPYELFSTSVQRFVEEASEDPRVLAIKGTLYRTSEASPIVAALMRAAERGKQVAVLVEVKARFDEQNNITWGERMEAAGVHVSYGFANRKIHTKLMLVVRQDDDGIRTYGHLGTGNYNAETAQHYADLGLFTCDGAIGADLVNLFHHITGYAPEQTYAKLVVAPWHMRPRLLALIQREIDAAEAGAEARIVLKMNGLDDETMIRALYRASQAGVQVDLVVRGHSRLRPGVPGYSHNIRLRSIIGRFLEHDRVFLFHNRGERELFLGSADWKSRNLADRIETLVPVEAPPLKARLVALLEAALADNRLAWELGPDGRYTQLRPGPGEEARGLHDLLMARALEPAP